MAGRFHPTDAGQLLFGPLLEYLSAYGVEKRARSERQDYRAEQKRRYDERMAMEREQIAQRQAAEVLGIQAKMAAMPARQALEFAPAAAAAFPQMGATGKAAAAQYAPSPVDPRVLGLAEGLSGFSGGLPEGEGPLPPGGGTPRQYPYPGTFALTKRAGFEKQQEEQALNQKQREMLFRGLSGAGAPFTALDVSQAGHLQAPVTPEHLGELVTSGKAEAEASERRKDKRAAARRGGGAASLSALSSVVRAGYSTNNPSMYDAAAKQINAMLGANAMPPTAEVFAGKTREERQQVARLQYSAVAPAIKTQIADIQKELRTIAANPPSAQSTIAKPAAEKALVEAKKELANLMRSAGLSPDRIELQRKAGPVPAEELADLAEEKALEWGVTSADALKELQDMGYTPAETR